MKIETNLCMGCMSEVNKTNETDECERTNCPFCGYGYENAYPASFLAPKTYLNNRYILGKLLSYNGEGALYLALDTEMNMKVTIKEYMPDTLCTRGRDEESIVVNMDCAPLYKTYLSEFIDLNKSLIKTEKTLRIQKVLDVFTENNTAYSVFEYIVGISLKSYLSNLGGYLSWDQAKELFPPLLTTLNIIHSQGIIHRGISPSTIIVNERSELYLISFGIAASRTFGSELDFEVFNGYAPAELYNTCSRQGSWTDVYGISAVLYKVLTGQVPPDAVSRIENDSITEPMLINRNISANVSTVIMQGLALKKENRIETLNAFIDRLFETPTINFLNQTTETVIKKPTRNRNREQNQNIQKDESQEFNKNRTPLAKTELSLKSGYKTKPRNTGNAGAFDSGYPRRRNRSYKRKSYIKAITICVLLGLTVIGFLIAIILPALNPEQFNPVTHSTSTAAPVTESTDYADITEYKAASNTENTASIINEPLYKIPNFTNPSRKYEIIEKSANYNFLKIIPEYEFNSEVTEGYIFEQDIDPDSDVKSGTVLNVKVSKGAEFVALPDYSGISLDEYKGILSALNIKYDSKKEDSDEKENIVTRCSVGVGDKVNIAQGQTVTIYYSSGKPVKTTPAETAPVNADDETLASADLPEAETNEG